MTTTDTENFLESVKELRQEAEEKLGHNRYYLTIKKLDEILETATLMDVEETQQGDEATDRAIGYGPRCW